MGFLTNVSISNDFWHEIAKQPQKLVDAISEAMNDGTHDPLGEALNEREDAPEYRRSHAHRLRYQVAPQGVVVHKAEHYDTPQVIVNAYGMQPMNAARVSHAIDYGWLKGNKYRRKVAQNMVKVLRDEADRIEQALRRSGV